ncbi:PREDICTED: uncharacterized protein LOC104754381 isoform X1 [Camelina sativa]|uniref:Uncharacterized protein LOC104754381 isoform X1 n=1 Tax=Camelina sativa TaxID=90675 RepID=A0ABM0WQU7_CAMSA|nr:PREDICTED: uncharacterized protein LOC104754381 isoform X1 [Camelina sativa]
MSPKHLELSQSSVESCTLHLLSWRPFQTTASSKTLDSSTEQPHKPYDSHSTPKRPCLSDRSTAFSIEAFSRLSIADEDNSGVKSSYTRGGFRPVERKRRRRGSRSVSGRSSDRSGTLRCCSVNAQVTTCSEFQFAVGGGTTDSSGELFCEANWSSDVSEAARNLRRDRDFGEKEGGFGIGVVESMGNESGYGSEPGYRGDAEIGYGDEFDEEEEDSKPLFWGAGTESSKEICAGEKQFSDKKSHYRCRRGRRNDYNKAVDFMTHDISLLHLQPRRFDQNNGASSGEGCRTRVR